MWFVENKVELRFCYVVGDVHFTGHMYSEQPWVPLCHWLTGGQDASLVFGEPATAPSVHMRVSYTASEMHLVDLTVMSLGNDCLYTHGDLSTIPWTHVARNRKEHNLIIWPGGREWDQTWCVAILQDVGPCTAFWQAEAGTLRQGRHVCWSEAECWSNLLAS